MNLQQRHFRLAALLKDQAGLWRPQPFKEARPAWCAAWPEMVGHLLGLEDERVAYLSRDNGALHALVGHFVPAVDELAALSALPAVPVSGVALSDGHRARRLAWEVPGRKAGQIEAFAAAMGRLDRPLLEWCGGKGHLGRLLAATWGASALTLELDAGLCAQGESLATRAGVQQTFRRGDALSREALAGMAGRHAVALHACGDLHLALIRGAREAGLAALDVAPCCYNRTSLETSAPLVGGALILDRDDLKLTVSDGITASQRELSLRRKEMAWKLGFVAWRARVTGETYRSFRPIPDAWLKGGFADFCRVLAAREGLPVPAGGLEDLEAEGFRRAREVDRLNLVRLAFRRPLEVWLALDRALFLEIQGYEVRVAEFCERALTPRNILISAR